MAEPALAHGGLDYKDNLLRERDWASTRRPFLAVGLTDLHTNLPTLNFRAQNRIGDAVNDGGQGTWPYLATGQPLPNGKPIPYRRAS